MKLHSEDEVKNAAVRLLGSGEEIDEAAIKSAITLAGFRCAMISLATHSMYITLPPSAFERLSFEDAEEKFTLWAWSNWVWHGTFKVHVCSEKPLEVRLYDDGKLTIWKEEDYRLIEISYVNHPLHR